MNDANFEKALAQTLKNEGVVNGKTGYVNSIHDKGGETNYGITKAKARECGYKGKMCDIPFNTVKEIYYNEYWKKTNAQNIANFNISFLLFDFAVNTGVKNAVKKLQIAINKTIDSKLIIDGVFGAETKKQINNCYCKNREKFQNIFIAEILGYYTSLAKFNIFGKGWINRVANNIKFLSGV